MHWSLILLILAAELFKINMFISHEFEMSMIQSALIVTSLYFQGSGPKAPSVFSVSLKLHC